MAQMDLEVHLTEAEIQEPQNMMEIDQDSKSPCLIKTGNIQLFIMNGPDIPIAQKEFKDIQNILLINSDSIIF